MISIKDLNISYGKKKVINDLSLELSKHNIHGIVGLNGAGKTTLLNSIYGLNQYDSGSIDFNGEPLNKRQVSYLVTENYFYSNITGQEYLSLFKHSNFPEGQWNELFDLPLHQIIDHYSTGMKKKLALLGILKQDKSVMILDEPFNGLDIETCSIIRSILLHLKAKGKTIIITSHIIETLTNLCDHIHYIENGNIKYSKEKVDFSIFEREIQDYLEKKNSTLIKELID